MRNIAFTPDHESLKGTSSVNSQRDVESVSALEIKVAQDRRREPEGYQVGAGAQGQSVHPNGFQVDALQIIAFLQLHTTQLPHFSLREDMQVFTSMPLRSKLYNGQCSIIYELETQRTVCSSFVGASCCVG